MVKASVHQLFPSEAVRARLAAANLDNGHLGLAAAVDACCNPAELRWAVLGFRRWTGDGGSAESDLNSVWADLCAMSDVLARLVPRPVPQWTDGDSAEQNTVTISSEVSEPLQSIGPILREAFAASAYQHEQGIQAAWALGFSRVPLEWAPLAMALQSESKLEQDLQRVLGRSLFLGLGNRPASCRVNRR